MTLPRAIPDAPPTLNGYEHIPRRWNKKLHKYVANVVPGEFYVSGEDELISTTLGSCIACCIWDRGQGIGGLNHFMLPQSSPERQMKADGKDAAWAMEFLINGILLNGGSRKNLEIKYFGGAQMLEGLKNTGIGQQNIAFIEDYIERESLKVVARDVGGSPPRKILFEPRSGKVKVKRLAHRNIASIVGAEKEYDGKLKSHDSHGGEIDLF